MVSVATSFYQSSANRVYFYPFFNLRNLLYLIETGKTKREIAEHYGLKMEQVKELLKRYRRRERKIIAGIQPRPKGRPAPYEQGKTELERLRMGNKLLRDFLQLTGRK